MPANPRFWIIADDLTGALDTAAPFAAHGWRTSVVPWPKGGLRQAIAGAAARSAVVVVDTASRHLPAREAARRVRAVIGATRDRRRVRCYYKKIDSTLRGNVAAELSAFRQATGVRCLPLAPAFPAQGRTTRGGAVWVDGQPLTASPAARDAIDPAAAGDLFRLGPPGALDVFDAETDADLRRVATRLARDARLGALAGSGGLAGALAARFGRRQPRLRPRARGGVLVVSGSAHPTARAQAQALVAGGSLGIVVPVGPRPAARDLEAAVVLAVHRLRQGGAVVLACPDIAPGTRLPVRLAARAADRLAAAVRAVLDAVPVEAIVCVGGDTTAAVVAAMRWAPLPVAGGVTPGIAAVRLAATRRPRWLITKSGAFGDPATLRRLVRQLTTSPRAGRPRIAR
jgi:uncharacterized protein YgbK (DUF1537 family)